MIPRPFVDVAVGDLAAADRLAARLAAKLGIASPRRVRVGMNALYAGEYAAGSVMLRVGRCSVAAETMLDLANDLARRGLPVPQPASSIVVSDEGLAATAWALVMASGDPVDWRTVGVAVRGLHAIDPDSLPVGVPVSSPLVFPWWRFDEMLADLAGEIDDAAMAGLGATVARHREWRDRVVEGAVLCHGDVHPGNVVMTADGPVVLDWDLLCRAHPAWDHAMLLTLAGRWGGDVGVYPAFAVGYGESYADHPVARAFSELRNVAATLMRVRAGRTDPAARTEAQQRLRFWRGEPEAPHWAAQ